MVSSTRFQEKGKLDHLKFYYSSGSRIGMQALSNKLLTYYNKIVFDITNKT